MSRFFDLSSDDRALMLNNADWLVPLNLLDFLRDIGKHFSVNEMIKRDSVRTRLEERDHGISYTEFSYMLLQAYDFLYLCQHHRLHHPDGRQRSVGQHSFGQGTDPPDAGRSAAKASRFRC